MTLDALPVASRMHYLTEVGGQWRPTDYDVRNVVKGMKQEPFNGFSEFQVGDKKIKYDQSSMEEFMPVLMQDVGRRMAAQLGREVDVVPIPGSAMALGAPETFRIVDLASKFAQSYGLNAKVVPAIRWDAPREKAHRQNEFRSPDLYQPHMRLAERPRRPVLLFDDVMTSGSQMIAAARFLQESGCELAAGCVVARATRTQHENMFEWKTEDLPIKRQTINWGSLLK